jgi:hypothetical protein
MVRCLVSRYTYPCLSFKSVNAQAATGAAAAASFVAGAGTAVVEKLGGLNVNDR